MERRTGMLAVAAGVAAAAVSVTVLSLVSSGKSSVPQKAIPKAVVLRSMHADGVAQQSAYEATTAWLDKSWCAPLSKFTVYTPAQWAAISGPQPKTPDPLAYAYSAAAITPAGNSDFTLVPGYCHFYVRTPTVVTTTGQVGRNPYPITAPKHADISQVIAATDSRLPVAVGPIRYTQTNVELEVSYAISQGPKITYHHMLYELAVKMTPRQKAVTPKSLVAGYVWKSSKPSFQPQYVIPGPDGGVQLPPVPKMVKL